MFDITSGVVDLLGVGLTSNGQASLTSDTALASAGTRKAIGAAALTVESDLQASARATLFVSITADFDAVLSGSANATFRSPAAALTAESDVTADGGVLFGGSSAMSADSSTTAAATRKALGAASLTSASGSVSAGVRVTFGAADMTGDVAAAFAAGQPVKIRFGEAALQGDLATMEGTAFIRKFGTVSMTAEATVFQATASPVFRLRMATAKRSITEDWLLRRYPIDVGLSLIVKNGVVTEVEVPSQTELAEADYYFLGGRNNPITPAQRATLVAAGFGSYIEED